MAPIESEFLKQELDLLESSVKTLEYSFKICSKIGIKEDGT